MPVLGWVPGADAGAVSWLCTWWREVAGAGADAGARTGAGAVSWLRTWWRQVAGAGADAGCWRRCWCWAPGAGAGAVSWLRKWWRHAGAGAGRRCW